MRTFCFFKTSFIRKLQRFQEKTIILKRSAKMPDHAISPDGGMVDANDSKSFGEHPCEFDSRSGDQNQEQEADMSAFSLLFFEPSKTAD